MKNFRKLTVILPALLLVLCMLLTACNPGGGPQDDTTEQPFGEQQSTTDNQGNAPSDEKKAYVVDVKSIGGMAMEGVTVKVYADNTLSDLVDFGVTGGTAR